MEIQLNPCSKEVKGATCITYTGNPATIDYLAFTLPNNTNLDSFLKESLNINLKNLVRAKSGRNGYRSRFYYENITVLTDGGKEGMGHNVTLTGKSCDRLKGDLNRIISAVFESNGHFTRCDLAIDDFKGVLDLDEIQESIAKGLVVSRSSHLKEFNDRDKEGKFTGRAAYFGSRESATFIRIYDKALKEGEDYHWVRVELELKKASANSAMMLVRDRDLGEVAKSLLKDSLSFREKGTDKNRSRWPVAPWWAIFLEGVERLRLTSSKIDDSAAQQRRLEWYMSQARIFAEMVDVCGPGIIPYMYQKGKTVQAERAIHY